jgi:hypothetical protein
MSLTDQQIYERLGKIQQLPTLSQWGAGFSESIRGQIEKGWRLSERQKEMCERIFVENTEEEVNKLKNWEKEYTEKYYDVGLRIASYYKNQGGQYFGNVCGAIDNGEVPPRRSFLKMINNKYAKRVMAEFERPPRFSIHDHIIPNSKFIIGYNFSKRMMESVDSNRVSMEEKDNFKSRGGIIIEISDELFSASKGAKRYKVLPFGSMRTYWTEERFLKKKPKPKKAKK